MNNWWLCGSGTVYGLACHCGNVAAEQRHLVTQNRWLGLLLSTSMVQWPDTFCLSQYVCQAASGTCSTQFDLSVHWRCL